MDVEQNIQIEEAQNWLHQNGSNVSGIEQKLDFNREDLQGYPASKMLIKQKTKKKEDGPLEIVCRWVVENQIGKGQTPRPHPFS